jgi:hypothetical protein
VSPVTLQHLGLRLGRQTVAVADGVRIVNLEPFAQDPPLAVKSIPGRSVQW